MLKNWTVTVVAAVAPLAVHLAVAAQRVATPAAHRSVRSLTAAKAPAAVAAPAAAPATALPFTVDAGKSSLGFVFKQAGAATDGRFLRYSAVLAEPAGPSGKSIAVDIDMASLDTADADRDKILRGVDLFDVAKNPRAHFAAQWSGATAGNRVTLNGTLTLRGVARQISVPAVLVYSTEAAARVAKLTGEVVLNRLDFGVGQGDWKSTEWVENAVRVRFALRLVQAAAPAATDVCCSKPPGL